LTTHAWTVHNSPAYPELAPNVKSLINHILLTVTLSSNCC
jgi:hypothetical protein